MEPSFEAANCAKLNLNDQYQKRQRASCTLCHVRPRERYEENAHFNLRVCVLVLAIQTEYQYTHSTIRARTFWLVLTSKDCLRVLVASELGLG